MFGGARADTTIYCVDGVVYPSNFKGENTNSGSCYLTLLGKPNPTRFPEGWPSACFRLIWSGHIASRYDDPRQ